MASSRSYGAIPLSPAAAAAHPSIEQLKGRLETPITRSGFRDWRFLAQEVVDQDGRGTCVGFGFAAYMNALTRVQAGRAIPRLSAGWIYNIALRYDGNDSWRKANGNPDGTWAFAAALGLQNVGAALESDYPYNPPTIGEDPSPATRLTTEYGIDSYHIGYGIDALRDALELGPCVAVFNCTMDYDFPSGSRIGYRSGLPVTGAHCNCFWGYDDSTQSLFDQNQWGVSWADHGWADMSYDYWNAMGADVTVMIPNLSRKIVGDGTMDSRINAADVTLAMMNAVHASRSTDPVQQILDVNHDGHLNVLDVMRLLQTMVQA